MSLASPTSHYFVPPPTKVSPQCRADPVGRQGRWEGKKGSSTRPTWGTTNPTTMPTTLSSAGTTCRRAGVPHHALTREAVDFIDRHDDNPSSSSSPTTQSIVPSRAPMPIWRSLPSKHHCRIFAAMLANMDDSVGAVLAQLQKSGLKGDTLSSSLATMVPTRELTSSNAPYAAKKAPCTKGPPRPHMLQWKARSPVAKFTQTGLPFDIFATIASNSDSVSLPKAAEGTDLLLPHRPAYRHSPRNPLLAPRRKDGTSHGDWKLLRMGRRNKAGNANWELYNLAITLKKRTRPIRT